MYELAENNGAFLMNSGIIGIFSVYLACLGLALWGSIMFLRSDIQIPGWGVGIIMGLTFYVVVLIAGTIIHDIHEENKNYIGILSQDSDAG